MENILINILFVVILLGLSYIDIKSKQVPNIYCLVIIILSYLYEIDIPYGQRIIESILISIPLIIIWLMRKKGLGAGDIKLIFACTLVLGIENVLWGLFVGMIVAAITNLIIRRDRDKETPLVPFISLGIIVLILIK